MPRRNRYRGPRERGNRGGPRRLVRQVRAMEWEQRNNPSALGLLVVGGIAAAATWALITRPNLPGELDEWVYEHLPWPGEVLSQGTVTPGDGGDGLDDSTISPAIVSATLTPL